MENLILSNLQHSGALFRVRGILQCIDKRSVNVTEQDAIERLVNDSVRVAGREVGSYARAALQILSIKDVDAADDEALDLARILPLECKYILS